MSYSHHHRQLVPRVRKYLAENVDKTYIDVNTMARTLRDRHPEYSSTNERQFFRSVEGAYGVVLRDYGVDRADRLSSSGSSDDRDDSDDDLEVLDEPSSTRLNDRIADMYADKRKRKEQIDKDSELIDISSDDDKPEPEQEQERPPPPPPAPEPEPPKPKKRKIAKKPKAHAPSSVSLDDVGGVDRFYGQICDLVLHAKHPEVFEKLGAKAPRGALLHGPPGSGKTLLAKAIAGRLGLPFVDVAATELVGGVSGESEKLIREAFDRAAALAPCVMFVDEIDSICGHRANAQKDMERRMVSQLLASVDALDEKNAAVLLLAATDNPDSLDPGLRRAGRFEREIALGIPDLATRRDILRVLCCKLSLGDDVDLDVVAQTTPGYVGADLRALINDACTRAVKRAFARLKINCGKANGDLTTEEDAPPAEKDKENHLENGTKEAADAPDELQQYLDDTPFTAERLADVKIAQADFSDALKTTKPCAIREGIATVPDVTWDDIGSLADARRDLQLAVLAPIKYPEQLETLGLGVPSGVLLCGPPGCGKTLLAKAVANEAGVNFISVKGPELLNMYVGESERAVRTCFTRAKNSKPCVIFFDEFDSLCPKRQNNDSSGATRVVNQLLTEMDGVESREGVFVLAATNRPDIIDPAALRPGRLDRVLFVGMPSTRDRVDILKAITKKGTKPPLNVDVDLEAIAKATEGYTGADLAGLVRQAATEVLTDVVVGKAPPGTQIAVTAGHFQIALTKVRPSVSQKEMQHYEKLRLKYTSYSNAEMDTTESMDTV